MTVRPLSRHHTWCAKRGRWPKGKRCTCGVDRAQLADLQDRYRRMTAGAINTRQGRTEPMATRKGGGKVRKTKRGTKATARGTGGRKSGGRKTATRSSSRSATRRSGLAGGTTAVGAPSTGAAGNVHGAGSAPGSVAGSMPPGVSSARGTEGA